MKIRVPQKISSSEVTILFATLGISLATLRFGFGGVPYFATVAGVLFFGALTLTKVQHEQKLRYLLLIVMIVVIASLNSLEALHNSDAGLWGEILRASAIIAVLFISFAAVAVDEHRFTRIMRFTALSHAAVLSSVYIQGNVVASSRLSSELVATGALSEIALGTAWAGLLSRSKVITGISVMVAMVIIFETQMRTAGLALIFTVVMYYVISASQTKFNNFRAFIFLLGTAVLLIFLVVLFEDILRFLIDILLLNDDHRGISSGFSGRFENIYLGFQNFLNNPLTGTGFQNEVTNYTHNGYILTLAQMGMFVGGTILIIFGNALFRAISFPRSILGAIVFGLAVFYFGQPRNINFQLSPLIGIICAARILGRRSELGSNTHPRGRFSGLPPKLALNLHSVHPDKVGTN